MKPSQICAAVRKEPLPGPYRKYTVRCASYYELHGLFEIVIAVVHGPVENDPAHLDPYKADKFIKTVIVLEFVLIGK